MNVYDFDKTIYNGDSTLDFYQFCVKRKPYILLKIPRQLRGILKYILKKQDKLGMKQDFYCFLSQIKELEDLVNIFWAKNTKKIKQFYMNQKKEHDIIISASPEFLLNPIKEILGVEAVIASKVDIKTGKCQENNCYGEEKVIRLMAYFEENHIERDIDNFYTDSMSDIPLAKLAKHTFLVKNQKIEEINIL